MRPAADMISGPMSETSSDEAIVDARDVELAFGDVRALDGVSVSFEPGIVYGLLGPNGAGKTTLIRVLTTLLTPDAGTVRVAGVDVLADPTAARARIGLAGQFAAVDEFQTGRENVEMVGRLYGLRGREVHRRSDDVLERIGLSDAAGRQVKTYSGGMRRRLDLAASLVGRPEVMFLDEPTTGIDPRSRVELWGLIRDLVADGTTVLLTTQYLDEADELAARIAVIDDGRIISEGTAEELKDELGGAVLEITVGEAQRSEAMRALEPIGEPSLDEATGLVRVPARDGSRTLVEAVRALDSVGVDADDIGLRRPTLDDVFMALTDDAADHSSDDGSDDANPAGSGPHGRTDERENPNR